MRPCDWTLELERTLLRQISAEYRHLNENYFGNALTAPALALTESRVCLGKWSCYTRTLELSKGLIREHPWGAVIEVLKHEMAHQYVHEVLSARDESAHGPAFREVCGRFGIDATAAGVPTAASQDSEEARTIQKIARLLALANSTNRNEAEAATAAAQRLMLKYNVVAHTHHRSYAFRQLGRPSGRVSEHERLLAMILSRHFFVEVIWVPSYLPLEGKRGSVLEICGTRANLEMAEYVYSFLLSTAERLWAEHKVLAKLVSNRERRIFLAGVMAGFAEKLSHQSRRHREEGLVWVKDADLNVYYRKRHPRVRNVRYDGQRRTSTFTDGQSAGRNIVIHRAVESGQKARIRALLPAHE